MSSRLVFALSLMVTACGADVTRPQRGEPVASTVEDIAIEARRVSFECIDGCPGAGNYGTDTLVIDIEALDALSTEIEWLDYSVPGNQLAAAEGPIDSRYVELSAGDRETVYLSRSFDTSSCSTDNSEFALNVLVRVRGELIELSTTATRSMGWDC